MSWAEIKKINSDFKTPLDKLIKKNRIYLPSITLPDVWEVREPLPSARYGLASASANSVIYCIGGAVTASAKLNEAYNTKTRTWTSRAAMTTGRGYLAVAVVNNVIYCIAGTSSGSIVGTVEAYNIAANTWSSKTAMTTKRESFDVCVVNDLIYCIGGRANASTPLAANEVYNPSTNTWTAKADMPTARSGLGVEAVDGIIYCIGGLRDGQAQYYQINEAYNPTTNTWSVKAIMPSARNSFNAVKINNETIYCIGGAGAASAGYNAMIANEAYNAYTNMWTVKTAMPTERYRHTVCSADEAIYCLGGYASNVALLNNEMYSLKEINLCPVSKGDKVYSVTGVYTQSQTIAPNTVTSITADGYLYTKTDFIFGWIQKGE